VPALGSIWAALACGNRVLERYVVEGLSGPVALGLPNLSSLFSVCSRSMAVASTLAMARRKFTSSEKVLFFLPGVRP